MRINGLHFSGIGLLIGILLYELYHKQTKGSW